jgi:magnesium-transporting ATPase (P-type)/class 3 adenylate cyclase
LSQENKTNTLAPSDNLMPGGRKQIQNTLLTVDFRRRESIRQGPPEFGGNDKLPSHRGSKLFNFERLRSTYQVTQNMGSQMNLNLLEDNSEEEDENQNQIKLSFKANKEFPFDKFVRDVYVKKEELEQFFSMCTLMNRFTLEGEKNSKAQAMEDRAVSELLKSLGYTSSATSKKRRDVVLDSEFKVHCASTNHLREYIIIGVNFFSHNRDRLSIVFQEVSMNTEDVYLLVKGSEKSMNSVLNMKDKDKNLYRELIASYKNAGLKHIIYGIKKLTFEDVIKYRNSYVEISKTSRDQMEGYENLAIDMEKGLGFYGCIGVRDNICPTALDLVKTLNSMGMKISILSGDNQQNSLNAAQALDIIKGGLDAGQVCMVTSGKEEKIAGYLKRIMEQIHEDIRKLNQEEMKVANEEVSAGEDLKEVDMFKAKLAKKLKALEKKNQQDEGNNNKDSFFDFEFETRQSQHSTKRTLVIKGEALDVIMKNKYLLSQLKSILLFCQSIIGYYMQPLHKHTIVKLLKEQKEVVLAVGDGFNDIGMIKEANVGIQVSNSEVPVIFSDIVVSNVGLITKLMFGKTQKIHRNLVLATFLATWISCTHVAFYYFFYSITSEYSEFFVRETRIRYLVSLVLILIVSVFDVKSNQDLLSNFPILYREGEIIRQFFKVSVLGFIILSIVETMTVIALFTYFTPITYFNDGLFGRIEVFESCVTFISFTSAILKIVMSRIDDKKIVTGIIVVSAIIMSIIQGLNLTQRDLIRQFRLVDILKCLPIVNAILTSIIVSNCINWVGVKVFYHYLFSPMTSKLAKYNRFLSDVNSDKDKKKASVKDIKDFLIEQLEEFLNTEKLSKFRVTRMIQNILKISREFGMQATVNKTVSIDLFNYQIGLKRLTNYIEERVDRRKFMNYLMMITSKYSKVQFGFYFVVYIVSMLIGVFNPLFNFYLMFDTTIPYMIVGLVFVALASRMPKFMAFLTQIIVCLGLTSLICMICMGVVSLNRFEMNLVDMYNTRIWFTLVLDMIGSSFFVILHLLARILLTFLRFDSTDLYLNFSTIYEVKMLLSLVLYYTYLLMVKYKSDKLIKKDFLAKSKLKQEMRKSKEKLEMLMPEFVLERINTFEVSENFIADDAGEVTVIFCDICHFDEIVRDCKEKVIDILEDVFRAFDNICRNNGVQKIETVNKTYMACAGLKFVESKLDPWVKEIHHTIRAFKFARDIMNYANSYTYRAGKSLKMKIGIHYGNCIYGLLGYHKPQFSLIGDTVNTTSRHCTTGKAGYIILSTQAFGMLDEKTKAGLTFEEGIVKMKGKGDVKCYNLNVCASQRYIKKDSKVAEVKGSGEINGVYKDVHSFGSQLNLDNPATKLVANFANIFKRLGKQGSIISRSFFYRICEGTRWTWKSNGD